MAAEQPDQSGVKQSPSGKLNWGLPPRPRSAHHGERATAAAASSSDTPQQRRVTSSDVPAARPSQTQAKPLLPAPTVLGGAAANAQSAPTPAPGSNQHQRRTSHSVPNLQKPQRAVGQQATAEDVLAAVTWELGLHNKDYGQGLQGILAAVQDAVAAAGEEAREKAQRKGKVEQERAVKEVEARLERALADLRDKGDTSEKKLGDKVRELQAQMAALERDKRAVMAKAAQHRRESREAGERTGAQEAAAAELEARLEKQARAAAKAEAGFAKYKAEAEAQVEELQQQLEDARQQVAAAKQLAASSPQDTDRLPGNEDGLQDVTALVAELLEDVATTKQQFGKAMEKLSDEQESLRRDVKAGLKEFQTGAANLAREGLRHAQQCAAEVASKLSTCSRLGAMGFDDVNALVEKVSQLKHHVKEMVQQQVAEKELQAQRDKQWQKDITARDVLKDENQKLDTMLTLTRATLAAVRQQNEAHTTLISTLRKETAEAVAAARVAKQDLDKATNVLANREKQLQALNESLQQAEARLQEASDLVDRHHADREAAAKAAAEETAALIHGLILHLRGWYFHTEPPYPPPKPAQSRPASRPASPSHTTSRPTSPSRPSSRPASSPRPSSSSSPTRPSRPASVHPTPRPPTAATVTTTTTTTSTLTATATTTTTTTTATGGNGRDGSQSAICRLDHEGLMAAFAAFLARSRTLGLAADPGTPPVEHPPEPDPAGTTDLQHDALRSAESAVQFVADMLLGVPATGPDGEVRRSLRRLASGRRASVAGDLSDFMQTLVREEEVAGGRPRGLWGGLLDDDAAAAAAKMSPVQYLSSVFSVDLRQDLPRASAVTLGHPPPPCAWARASMKLRRCLSRRCTPGGLSPDDIGLGDGPPGDGGQGRGPGEEGRWWVAVAGEVVRLEGCLLTVLMELRVREGQLAEARQQLAEVTALLQTKKLRQWPKASPPLPASPTAAPATPTAPASPASPAAALNAQLVRSLAAEKKALAQKLRCLEAGGGPPPRDRLLPTGSRPTSALVSNWAAAGPSAALGVMSLGAARPGRPVSAQPLRTLAGVYGGGGSGAGGSGGGAAGAGTLGFRPAMRFSDGGSPTRSTEFQEIYAVLDLLDSGSDNAPPSATTAAPPPSNLHRAATAPTKVPRPSSALQQGVGHTTAQRVVGNVSRAAGAAGGLHSSGRPSKAS